MPYIVLNEYPKSGGTWIGGMLADALQIQFPRNRFPVLRKSIMHGHYIHPFGMRNVLCVWRDGRDVMVSWYHHCLFENEHENGQLVRKVRNDLGGDYDWKDIERNLPIFLNYSFSRQHSPRFSWSQFVDVWFRRENVIHTRYELFRSDAERELVKTCYNLTGDIIEHDKASEIVERYTFSSMSGRKPGQENKGSFLRKGIVGDWVNNFSQESKELFQYYAGHQLIELGYEKDDSWVSQK